MMNKKNDIFEIPLFFKLWFAFIAFIVICIISGTFYIGYSAIKAGPEGVGTYVGQIIKSYNESAK